MAKAPLIENLVFGTFFAARMTFSYSCHLILVDRAGFVNYKTLLNDLKKLKYLDISGHTQPDSSVFAEIGSLDLPNLKTVVKVRLNEPFTAFEWRHIGKFMLL